MQVDRRNVMFHLPVFAVSFFAAFYEFFYVRFGHQGFPGKFRYLTYWNICFQTFYFGLCVLTDLTGSKSKSLNAAQQGTIKQWRDVMHACIVFPTTVFVFSSFWSIYAIDRELVHPKAVDAFFPSWLNHLVHTTILPFIVMEKFLSHHQYPRRSRGFVGVCLVAFIYTSIVLLVAYFDDFWVYPILQVLSMTHRAAFILSCVVFFVLFYILGESFTSHIWGRGLTSPKGTQKTFKKA